MDAMVLFAYSNKQYDGGYRESNIRHTDRWRHCFKMESRQDGINKGKGLKIFREEGVDDVSRLAP